MGYKIDRETSKGWLIGHCPFAPYAMSNGKFSHKGGQDTSPSFNVKINDEGTSGFWCFTCKHKGSLRDMFTYMSHYDRKNSKKWTDLANEAGAREFFSGTSREFDTMPKDVTKPKPISEKLYHNMYPPAWRSLMARTYLKHRGIGEATCEMLGILWDPNEKRIVFPIRDRENRLYGFTGRTILPDAQWKKIPSYGKVKDFGFDEHAEVKKQFLLLGAQLVDLTKPILLIEGLFALAHMLEIGVDEFIQPVASMGAHLSNYQAGILEDWGKPLYALYDRDGSGHIGLHGTNGPDGEFIPGLFHKMWQRVPTYEMKWPKGFADPDKLSKNHVQAMVRLARLVAY